MTCHGESESCEEGDLSRPPISARPVDGSVASLIPPSVASVGGSGDGVVPTAAAYVRGAGRLTEAAVTSKNRWSGRPKRGRTVLCSGRETRGHAGRVRRRSAAG